MPICAICGKAPSFGRRVTRRGAAKRRGGAGQKITGIASRMFRPNLQRVRAVHQGRTRRIMVCTGCLKAGKVVRAV